MSSQIELPVDDQVRAPFARLGEEILAACRDLVRGAGKLEVVAEDARMDPPQLSRALNARGYNLGVHVLPVLFRHDRERVLIRLLCRMCGGRFVEEPRLTPEQRLEIYRRAVEEAAPAVADIAARRVRDEEGGPT
jgi:hypothetical protein